MIWRKSLSAQLGRQMILMVVMVLILVGGGLIRIARQAELESAHRLQEEKAAKVSTLITDYVSRAIDSLQLFETMTALCKKSRSEQKGLLEDLLMNRVTLFSQLTLVSAEGTEVVKISRFHTYLEREMGGAADRVALTAALDGAPYIGSVYLSPESGLLSVRIAVPCNGAQDRGALVAEVNISRLWQAVSKVRIGGSGYAYLVDRTGRFVAYQEFSKVLQRYGEDMRGMPPVADYVTGKPRDADSREYPGLNQEFVIGHYEPILGTSWAVIVESPVREAYAAARKMQWYLSGMTLCGVILAGLAAFVVSSRLVRPIRELTLAAQRIGAGDLGAPVVEIPVVNEVDVLTGAFRRMQHELGVLYGNLERQLVELRQTEDALRQSRRQLRDISDNIPGLIFQFIARTDGYMGLTYLSERTMELTGLDGDLCDFFERFTAHVSPEDRSEFRSSVFGAVSSFSPWVFEGRFVKPTGEIMWFQVTSIPQKRGEDVLFNGVLLDITERKRAEAALRESEAGFRTLVSSSPEGILLHDLDGFLMDANQSFTRMTGYTVGELRGKHLGELVPGEYKIRLYESIEEIKRGLHRDSPLEIELTKKNGSLISAIVREWLVKGDDGEPIALGAFVADITEEKWLAKEKKALEGQLLRNQKMEAIGTMAGGIAHDFNNILTGIMGYTELAMITLGEDHPDISSNLSASLAASNRARALVQQLLRFSRKEASELGPVSLRMLLKEAIQLVRSTLPSTIRIEEHFTAEKNVVMADPTQLHQVIMNLCINAYHAMKPKGGTLSIDLRNTLLSQPKKFFGMECQPGRYAVLTVRDTGTGIAPEHLDRIFEPYFTTKKQNEGTGLGLSVTFGVIKSHGGLIEVESTPDEGTAFSIYLPLMQQVATQAKGPGLAIPKGHEEHILVVDDEFFFRDVVKEMLKGLNYRVSAYEGSVSALDAFTADPAGFDAVITDQTMPDMTGIELISKIRTVNGSLPIILCTGYSDDVTEESSKHYGITRLLHKPISREELGVALNKALAERENG